MEIEHLTLPYQAPNSYHVFRPHTIRVTRRDALPIWQEEDVATITCYPVPLHWQPVYDDPGYIEGILLEAEAAAKEILSIPMFPELTVEQPVIYRSCYSSILRLIEEKQSSLFMLREPVGTQGKGLEGYAYSCKG